MHPCLRGEVDLPLHVAAKALLRLVARSHAALDYGNDLVHEADHRSFGQVDPQAIGCRGSDRSRTRRVDEFFDEDVG